MDPDPFLAPIILVERNNCSFVRKTRNAQEIGGAMVIIANNKDEDLDQIIMVDDGSGNGINIPAVMIKHSDGQSLIQAMKRMEIAKNKEYPIIIADFKMVNSI